MLKVGYTLTNLLHASPQMCSNNEEQPQSMAQTSQACEDIGAGPQGKRPQSAQTGKACDGNRPFNSWHGAGPQRSSWPAT